MRHRHIHTFANKDKLLQIYLIRMLLKMT